MTTNCKLILKKNLSCEERILTISVLFVFSLSVISNSIQLLVQDLDAACDPALTAMSKVGTKLIDYL